MGNRSFFYLVDRLPSEDEDEDQDRPDIVATVGESNNSMPALYQALLAAAADGPAQDEQQVFFPSNAGGLYAERVASEARLFKLLDFYGGHPRLQDADQYRDEVDKLRSHLATLPGEAFSGDVNEWLYLIGEGTWDDLDELALQFKRNWALAEDAIDRGDYAALDDIYEIDPANVMITMGLEGIFWGWNDGDDEPVWEEEVEPAGSCAGHTLFRFEKDGLFGLRAGSLDGAEVLPAKYERILDFDAGSEVGFMREDDKWGVFHRNGEVLVAPQFSRVGNYACERALANLDGLTGYLGPDGRFVIEPQFDGSCTGFDEDIAWVAMGECNGRIGKNGEIIVPPLYEFLEAMRMHGAPEREADLYAISHDYADFGVYSVIHQREVLPCAFDEPVLFRFGGARYLLAYGEDKTVLCFGEDLSCSPEYDWIDSDEYRCMGNSDVSMLLETIMQTWTAGNAVRVWREGRGMRLFADGSEVAEAEYKAHRPHGQVG